MKRTPVNTLILQFFQDCTAEFICTEICRPAGFYAEAVHGDDTVAGFTRLDRKILAVDFVARFQASLAVR